MNYEKQAIDFLAKTNVAFKTEFVKNAPYFADDKESRDIYQITLTRGERTYSFKFGQSITNSGFIAVHKNNPKLRLVKTVEEIQKEYPTTKSEFLDRHFRWFVRSEFGTIRDFRITYPKAPTAYDVLSALVKYECDDFGDFCSGFGYDDDSIKAHKIWLASKEEWSNVQRIWSDAEIEELREIQ